MSEVDVRYKGMSSIPSDRDCPDGDMAVMVDLHLDKGGQLRCIPPLTQIATISGRLIRVHKGEGYENYLTEDDGSIYSQVMEDGELSERTLIAEGFTGTTAVEVIGNTIIIISANQPICYLLYKDSAYQMLGEQPPLPEITFSTSFHQCYEEDEDHEITTDIGVDLPLDETEELSDDDQTTVTERVFAAVNSMISYNRSEGYYCYPAFIRYALRLYDGTLTRHSAPILLSYTSVVDPSNYGMTNYTQIVTARMTSSNEAIVSVNGYKINFEWPGYDESWSDVVTSVDLFITAPIATFDQNGTIESKGYNHSVRYLDLPFYDEGDIDNSIRGAGQFYKMYSIPTSGEFTDFGEDADAADPFSSSTAGTPLNELLTDNVLTTIEQQELLEDEYQSHHRISANCSYVYNAQLHLADLTTTLFDGFPYTTLTKVDASNRWEVSSVVIDVHISTLECTARVRVVQEGGYFYPYGSFYYYPDSRASQMDIYVQRSGQWSKATLQLESHDYLNGAYYFKDGIVGISSLFSDVSSIEDAPDGDQKETSSNVLKVSVSSNPFAFEVSGVYTIGNATIYAISSSTKAISQGQFGQYPLYTLTEEGIWALEVSSTGSYSTTQVVAREVCNNRDSVLQLDGAVAFSTDRGILALVGAEVSSISDFMGGSSFNSDLLMGLSSALDKLEMSARNELLSDIVPFLSYLKGCGMAYDYYNSRIIVYNPERSYSYIYDIGAKSWALVSQCYTSSVNNFPDSYLMGEDGELFLFSEVIDEDSDTQVKSFAITRPLKLEQPDQLKAIRALMHRGNFAEESVASILYGSKDGEKYLPIASSADYAIRRVRGSAYKYFRLVLFSKFYRRNYISCSSLEAVAKHSNKLR